MPILILKNIIFFLFSIKNRPIGPSALPFVDAQQSQLLMSATNTPRICINPFLPIGRGSPIMPRQSVKPIPMIGNIDASQRKKVNPYQSTASAKTDKIAKINKYVIRSN